MFTLGQEFFVFPEELQRIGNSTSPRLTSIREGEVIIIEMSGVKIVVANGMGVSVWTLEKVIEIGLSGIAWRFEKGTRLPPDLRLVNDKPGHYLIAPVHNMPLDKYKGLLEELGLKCAKYLKVTKEGKCLPV